MLLISCYCGENVEKIIVFLSVKSTRVCNMVINRATERNGIRIFHSNYPKIFESFSDMNGKTAYNKTSIGWLKCELFFFPVAVV